MSTRDVIRNVLLAHYGDSPNPALVGDTLMANDRAEVLHGTIAELEKRLALIPAWLVSKDAVLEFLRNQAKSPEKCSPAGADATPHLIVYRASHDSIVMGLYTTPAEARAHCEDEERRSWSKGAEPTSFDWIEDEEDGVAELTAWVGSQECLTGYVVTALEIASKYAPEADE